MLLVGRITTRLKILILFLLVVFLVMELAWRKYKLSNLIVGRLKFMLQTLIEFEATYE